MLWGCELNEKWTWTFKPQREGKQNCELLLNMICLGEKAKEEMNVMGILPPESSEDKKMKPITMAPLQVSVLPMVIIMGCELSPLDLCSWVARNVRTFQVCLRKRSRRRRKKMCSWRRRPLSSKSRGWCPRSRQALLRKKRSGESREAVRFSHEDNSPARKVKPTLRPRKPGSEKWGARKPCSHSDGDRVCEWTFLKGVLQTQDVPPPGLYSVWVWLWWRCWGDNTRTPHPQLSTFSRTWREESWPQGHSKISLCQEKNKSFTKYPSLSTIY